MCVPLNHARVRTCHHHHRTTAIINTCVIFDVIIGNSDCTAPCNICSGDYSRGFYCTAPYSACEDPKVVNNCTNSTKCPSDCSFCSILPDKSTRCVPQAPAGCQQYCGSDSDCRKIPHSACTYCFFNKCEKWEYMCGKRCAYSTW